MNTIYISDAFLSGLCMALACLLAVAVSYIVALQLVKQEDEKQRRLLADPAYEAACAWRRISLALTNNDHPEACQELAALRAVGWHIEKSGSQRGGFVYLKLIAPDHKE